MLHSKLTVRVVDSPEWSSFTSDDMVFVIESAATNRSFRRFLGTPTKQAHGVTADAS